MSGRPRKFKTVEEIEALISDYFNMCDKTQEPYTITGLALSLGTTRQGLLNYESYTDINDLSFLDTIKKARAKVEKSYELRCISRGNGGDIFALKQFGWTDRQEIIADVKADVTIETLVKQVEGDEY